MADRLPEFDESLMPAEQPAELALIQLDERHMEYARARWPDASERMQQYRVRQTIWVRFEHRKPHPDDPTRRRLGGPQPNSGRRVTKAIGAAIVEHFEGRQKEVLDAIAAPLDPNSGASAMERHKAGMNIAKHAREERAMEIVEDEYARKTDDDVALEFAREMAQMVRSGELSLQDIQRMADAEGEVVEEQSVGQLSA